MAGMLQKPQSLAMTAAEPKKLRAGATAGMLGGMALLLLLQGTLVVGTAKTLYSVDVAARISRAFGWTDGGAAEVEGTRQLQNYNWDWDTTTRAPEDQAIGAIIGLVYAAIILGICVGGPLICMCYWACYIRPNPDWYLREHLEVPQDLKGRWTFSLFDCCKDPGTCACFCCCSPCATVDLWLRAGWLHGTLGSSEPCPGGWWWAGLCGYMLLEDVAGCCVPCVFAAFRGGLGFLDNSDAGMGKMVPIRKRFEIPHNGWSTFCADCCVWCWCGPCAGTQEYQQVTELLKRNPRVVGPPVAVGMAAPGMVVGQPVQQVHVVQASVVEGNQAK